MAPIGDLQLGVVGAAGALAQLALGVVGASVAAANRIRARIQILTGGGVLLVVDTKHPRVSRTPRSMQCRPRPRLTS